MRYSFSLPILISGIYLFAVACAGVSSPSVHSAEDIAVKQAFVITHVNIVPITGGGSVLSDATVVISHERIISINGPVPAGAVPVNGNGKWLMPGLIDMHVHVPTSFNSGRKYPTRGATIFFNTQDIMTPFIANGVTTVDAESFLFQLWQQPGLLARFIFAITSLNVSPRLYLTFAFARVCASIF